MASRNAAACGQFDAKAVLGDDFAGFVLADEPLSRHTTYRIGGPASLFAQIDSLGSLTSFIEYCHASSIPWIVIGKGSNLLVSDAGFKGAVITLGPSFSQCVFDVSDGVFCVGAGARLSHVVQEAFRNGRAGYEFAVGTPGTVGGALRMNAGSRFESLGERVLSVTSLRPGAGLVRYRGSDIDWGYRASSLPYDEVVLECELSSLDGEEDMIRAKMEGALARRKRTQPLQAPSCGSVFKNPEGHSVGRLIEEAGLKGTACGGAQISMLHGNFIVNNGDATADEVLTLIHFVQDTVKDRFGVDLAPEVRFLGFE